MPKQNELQHSLGATFYRPHNEDVMYKNVWNEFNKQWEKCYTGLHRIQLKTENKNSFATVTVTDVLRATCLHLM